MRNQFGLWESPRGTFPSYRGGARAEEAKTKVPGTSSIKAIYCRRAHLQSMGDLQDPIHGGTLVPYVWPYELWGYSLT